MTNAKDELKKFIAKNKTQAAAAEKLGVSPSLITEIMSGRRNISERMLFKLGFRRIVIEVKAERVPRVMKALESVL